MRPSTSTPLAAPAPPAPPILDLRLEAQRGFWRERLAAGFAAPRLPGGEEPGDGRPRRLEFDLGAGLGARLEALAGGSPFLLYAALVSGLTACFYRHGSRGRVALGSPVLAADGIPGAAHLVPVICPARGDWSFRQLLPAVREELLEVYARQDYPPERLAHDLGLGGDDRRRPFLPLVAALAGLHGEAPRAGQEATLTFSRERGVLLCRVEHRLGRAGNAGLARLVLHLGQALARGTGDSRLPLRELAVLTPAERQLHLVELNDTASPAPAACLHELFESQAARTPQAPALSWRGGEMSYRRLDARAGALACRLRGLGVGPEVRVGLLLPRSPEMVVALLAVLKAGGAYLPVDPGQPDERLRFLLADGGVALVLTDHRLRARVPETVAALEVDAGDPAESAAGPGAGAGVDNLAYVLYTSGSTGRPKGVMVTHRGAVNYLTWCRRAYDVAGGSGCPVHSPLGFDLTVTSLLSPLAEGRRADLLPEGRPVEELCAALADVGGYSLVKITPAHLEALAHWLPPKAAAQATRAFVIGGEALRTEHLDFFRAHAPRTRLINEYGPTEAVVGCCVYEVPYGDLAPGAVPIGRPIPGVRLLVLDGDLQPVPAEVTGELFIGGLGLARGYLGRPELTAERFVPDPLAPAPGARLYRSGDLARLRADGNLEYLGRDDGQVKVRGYRVELGEIEAALGSHSGIEAAVALLREDVPGRQLLVAYVVGAAGTAPDPAGLRAFLGERLPGYMVPQAFVPIAALPLTGNGKVDRRALPALASPRRERPAGASPVAELLAGIWEEVLGRGGIDPADSFFELGGQSLSATRVAARVRDALGVEVPPSALFETPILAGFARRIEAGLGAGDTAAGAPIARVRGRQAPALSFAQEHLWFLEQLKPGEAAFNIPAGLRVRGRLDPAALACALGEAARRHEALRTLVPTRAGEPAPVVAPPRPWTVPAVDLRGLPAERRERAEAALAAEEARRPFDLGRGPLLRSTLLRLGEEEHLLVLIVHHIAADGWSMVVLMGELAGLYGSFARGEPSLLPELPIQYADYAAWQRERLTPEALGRHLAYWRGRLAGAPEEVSFPPDRPRPGTRSVRGALHPVALPRELAAGLRSLAGREGATLYMTLLAGFALMLGAAAGRDEVVVGTDLANRERSETEGLIGLFVNQFPLRIDAGGDPAFRELLARSRRAALEAYLHQEVPFGKLVEALRPERRAGLAPLFQVKLILQNYPRPALDVPGLDLQPVSLDSGTAQLDVVLALWETPAGLKGWINYNTDLFDAATVGRLGERYREILAGAVAAPAARVSHLKGLPGRSVQEHTDMSNVERGKTSFGRFKQASPRMVSLPAGDELIEKGYLASGQTLPLVLRPRVEGVDLPDWVRDNRPLLERELLAHGAILFRGFGVDSSARFERFAAAVSDDLFNENGEHPREVVSGNVYTPVFYPPDKHLLWHNENSFNMSWPRKIMFCCARPADEGGETPIVDSRKVCARLAPEVRDPFVRLGVMYQRNFGEGLGLPWQTVFQAATRAEAEEKCRRDGIEAEWHPGDRLRTRSVRPAVVRHPESGEMAWFNQAQHWHLSCLDAETRESMTALFDESAAPRHCYYGDGTPIAAAAMQSVLDAYRELEVCFAWQRGDVLLLDNILTAHARNPFKGKREILVAMGDMARFAASPPAAGVPA